MTLAREFFHPSSFILHPSLAALILVLVFSFQSSTVRADDLALVEGCNNVALPYAAGTPLSVIAAAIQPVGFVSAIFRYDVASTRFLAFAPTAPAAVSDYAVTQTRFEPVFICMFRPGVLVGPPIVAIVAPAMPVVPAVAVPLAPGIIAAPRTARRGDTVEILIGAGPNIACVGGVNIPTGTPFYRFVAITTAAGPSGVAAARFDITTDDAPGFADFAVRCGTGQYVRWTITIT